NLTSRRQATEETGSRTDAGIEAEAGTEADGGRVGDGREDGRESRERAGAGAPGRSRTPARDTTPKPFRTHPRAPGRVGEWPPRPPRRSSPPRASNRRRRGGTARRVRSRAGASSDRTGSKPRLRRFHQAPRKPRACSSLLPPSRHDSRIAPPPTTGDQGYGGDENAATRLAHLIRATLECSDLREPERAGTAHRGGLDAPEAVIIRRSSPGSGRPWPTSSRGVDSPRRSGS